MSQKDLSLALNIDLATSGVGKLTQGINEIKKAGIEVDGLENGLDELTRAFDDISNQQRLIEQFKSLKRESKELSNELKNGAGDSDKLTTRKKELAQQLKAVRADMDKAGIAVKNLNEKEKQLAAQSKATEKALDELTDEARELQSIADAKIKLGLDTDDKARKELEAVTAAYKKLEKSGKLSSNELARANQLHTQKVAELEAQLVRTRPTLNEITADLGKFATAGAAFTLIAREAMQFESAMAGVKKVVDGTPEEIDALGGEIKQLAQELGIVPEKVAEIAASGGQLGVAIEDLPNFIRLAGEMSVAFDMTAEDAANAAAKLSNVWGIPLDQVRDLGDAINTLGNNTAAREAEITAAMLRIGGNAKQFGLAATEAAALADAMIALGKPPEVAATAINALLLKLQTGQSQGKKFQAALGGIGYTAEQMAANIQTNPQQALSDFLNKLGELDTQSRALALADLFGAEYADDISLLVGSLGEYEKALSLVEDKTKTTGALNNEFKAQMDKAEMSVTQAKIAVSNLAKTLGKNLLPIISDTADGVGNAANAVNKLAETYPLITKLAIGLTGFKVAALAVSSATNLLSLATRSQAKESLAMNAGLLATGKNAVTAAINLNRASVASTAYASALKGMSVVINTLKANPIIFTITTITAAISAIDSLVGSTEKWEESTEKAYDAIYKLQEQAAKGVKLNLDDAALKPINDALSEIDQQIQSLSGDGTGVFDFAKDALPFLDSNVEKMQVLFDERQKLIDQQAELQAANQKVTEAEEAKAQKALEFAAEQKVLAEQSLEILKKRKAELEQSGETESGYYQFITQQIHTLNGTLDETATKTREAFEAVGLSFDEIATGMTDVETKITGALQTGIEQIKEMGGTAEETSQRIKRYLGAAFDSLKTPEGITAAIAELEKLENKTPETVNTLDALKRKLAATNPAFKELAANIAKATSVEQINEFKAAAKSAFDKKEIGLDEYNLAMKDAANATKKVNEEIAQSTQKATAANTESTKATKEDTAAKKENAEANKAVSGSTAGLIDDFLAVRNSFVESEQAVKHFDDAMKKATGTIMMSPEHYAKEMQRAADSAIVVYKEWQNETQRAEQYIASLNQRVAEGKIGIDDMALGANAAEMSFSRLNDAQLSKIQGEIDKARQKVVALDEQAKKTAQSIADELANATGSEEDKINLEYKRRIEKVREQDGGTGRTGDAVANLEKLRQIKLNELREREAEQAERERERQANAAKQTTRRGATTTQSQPFDVDEVMKQIDNYQPQPHVDTKTAAKQLADVFSKKLATVEKNAAETAVRNIVNEFEKYSKGQNR